MWYMRIWIEAETFLVNSTHVVEITNKLETERDFFNLLQLAPPTVWPYSALAQDFWHFLCNGDKAITVVIQHLYLSCWAMLERKKEE